jgi:hypothetical protein
MSGPGIVAEILCFVLDVGLNQIDRWGKIKEKMPSLWLYPVL